MKTYRQMNFNDRKIIEEKLNNNESLAIIAQAINRSLNAIYKEIGRCPKGEYNAKLAQKDADSKLELRKKTVGKKISKTAMKNHENQLKNLDNKRNYIVWEIASNFTKLQEEQKDMSLEEKLLHQEEEIKLLKKYISNFYDIRRLTNKMKKSSKSE